LDTKRLRELLFLTGKSQKQAATDIGISAERFNLYVNGKREPDNSMLTDIADYFNVSVDYLLGRDDDSTENELDKELKKALSKVSEERKEELLRYLRFLEEENK